MKTKLYIGLFVSLLFILQGCLENEIAQIDVEDMTIETIVVPQDFSYSTTKTVEVSLQAPVELSNATFSLIAYKANSDSLTFAKATFDDNGFFSSEYTLATFIDTILVKSNYLGLINEVYIPIQGKKAEFDYSEFEGVNREKSAKIEMPSMLKSAEADGYTYLGGYNSSGVPDYLTTRDNIQQNLLDDINASLPEYNKVPETNPEFLASGTESNIVLTKTADVWVTFVAEGAGYRNALGYYTYREDDPPSSIDEIEDLNIIFPNVSAGGSGGGLIAGDKVYLGRFHNGTVIAWFLVADGWNGSDVGDGRNINFSQPSLNVENDPALNTHMVMLWDKSREQFLLGFEDIPRDQSGCDQDFNDAVFYATANPVDAVKKVNVQEIKAANDSDGDGINDELDDFPYDPNKSFNNFSPSAGSNGSLVYEDLWPSKGDYDFNDLVVNYNYNLIANAQNKISTIEADFEIEHIGAGYENGFAFILPISTSKILGIENQEISEGYISLSGNGTESGFSNESVIFVTDDATKQKGKTISIVVNLSQPVNKSELGDVPFNPFIVVNGERSREVHLPDMAPTSKGRTYLGQLDDFSDVNNGRYFKSDRNLPWALNIYSNFSYPPEKTSIDRIYPKFVTWANSGGTKEMDWYR